VRATQGGKSRMGATLAASSNSTQATTACCADAIDIAAWLRQELALLHVLREGRPSFRLSHFLPIWRASGLKNIQNRGNLGVDRGRLGQFRGSRHQAEWSALAATCHNSMARDMNRPGMRLTEVSRRFAKFIPRGRVSPTAVMSVRQKFGRAALVADEIVGTDRAAQKRGRSMHWGHRAGIGAQNSP
jgi:hypothetical protein